MKIRTPPPPPPLPPPHSLGVWLRIGTSGGDDFSRSDLKTSCIKNIEYESQTKKKDSDCSLYNQFPLSLTNIFSLGAKNFFPIF